MHIDYPYPYTYTYTNSLVRYSIHGSLYLSAYVYVYIYICICMHIHTIYKCKYAPAGIQASTQNVW